MQLRHVTSAIALSLALANPLFAAEKSSGFKCWTNKDGVRECGNAVPPEYAQGRTETVNKQGMTTKVEERAKSAADLAEEERKRHDADARAADEKQKQQEEATRQQEQAKYDRMLKASFLKEEDIESARKRKLGGIDASIELTRVTIDKLEEKLKKEEQKASKQKPSASPAANEQQKAAPAKESMAEQPKAGAPKKGDKGSETANDDVEMLKKQLADKQAYIATREQEKEGVNAEYDGYLKRFRELKGIKAP